MEHDPSILTLIAFYAAMLILVICAPPDESQTEE